MTNAVAKAVDFFRGTAPVSPGTAPSEHEHHDARAHHAVFRRQDGAAVEDALTPRSTSARDRASDVSITKVHVPLTMSAGMIGAAIVIAFQLWNLGARIDNVSTQLAAEQRHNERYQSLLEKNVDLQIQNAGLRTSAMDLATKLSEITTQLNALKGR